jgi:hypothetical protein
MSMSTSASRRGTDPVKIKALMLGKAVNFVVDRRIGSSLNINIERVS